MGRSRHSHRIGNRFPVDSPCPLGALKFNNFAPLVASVAQR